MRIAINNYVYRLWRKVSARRQDKQIRSMFRVDMERFDMCANRKSARQIAKEIKALEKYWNCYPYQYFKFDMYHKDCKMTMQEMLDYLPYYFMAYIFWPHSCKGYFDIAKNKFLSYMLFNSFQEAQPKIFIQYDGGYIYDHRRSLISNHEFDKLLLQIKSNKLFLKPNKGSWGLGIIVFKQGIDGYYTHDGQKLSVDYLRTNLKKEDYILQEGIVQTKEMSEIYPNSINTVRVITKCVDQKPSVLYTVLRMGQGGAQVDNAGSGGLFLSIDVESGRLYEYAHEHTVKNNTYTQHPDTGFIFKDKKINGWEELKQFCLINALKMREIAYVGWDVALTDEGPVLVELNTSPDMYLAEADLGGLRQGLGIDPQKWFKSGRKIGFKEIL